VLGWNARLVAALVQIWEADQHPGGKAIWINLQLDFPE
jgi:hypothetical protein